MKKPRKQTPAGHPLNIRNVPEDLYWRCKERAAQNRMKLRDFVLAALERATTAGTDEVLRKDP